MQGCDDGGMTRAGYAKLACERGVRASVQAAENHFVPLVEDRCKALRDKVDEEGLDADKADEIRAKCEEKGAGALRNVSEEEKKVWSEACENSMLDFVNRSGAAANQLREHAAAVLADEDIAAAYGNLLNTDWRKTLTDLTKESGVNVEGSDAEELVARFELPPELGVPRSALTTSGTVGMPAAAAAVFFAATVGSCGWALRRQSRPRYRLRPLDLAPGEDFFWTID